MSDYEDVLGASSASNSGGGAAGFGSGLIGGILDAFIGPVMSNVQFQRSKHVSNRQMRAAEFLAENQPSWAVQGLVNAGLNPILAATKGVAPAQFAPSAKTSLPDTGSFSRSLEGGVSSAKTLSLLNGQAKLLEEQIGKARNEREASVFLKDRMMGEIGEIASRIRSLEQGIQTSASQANLNEAQAGANRANTVLSMTRNRAERGKIPYSEEQMEMTAPMREFLEKPGNLIRGVLRSGKRLLGKGADYLSGSQKESEERKYDYDE